MEQHGACFGEIVGSERGERFGYGLSHHGEVVLAVVRGGIGGRGRSGRVTAGEGEAAGFDGELAGRFLGGGVLSKVA